MRSRSGVTLIEMLVAVGIVGVLAAILIPTGMAARRVARRVSGCTNNLRQIGAVYTQDFLEHGTQSALYTPFNNNTNYPTMLRIPSGPTNLGKIYQELEKSEVIACPEAEPYTPDSVASNWNNGSSVVFGSYIPRNFEQGASPNQALNGFPRADANTAIIADYNRVTAIPREKARINVNHRGQVVHYVTLGNGVGSLGNEDGWAYIQSFNDIPRFWRSMDEKTR